MHLYVSITMNLPFSLSDTFWDNRRYLLEITTKDNSITTKIWFNIMNQQLTSSQIIRLVWESNWPKSVFLETEQSFPSKISMRIYHTDCYELKFLISFSFSFTFLFYFPYKEAARYDSNWALKLILSSLLCFTYCFILAFHIRFNVSS